MLSRPGQALTQCGHRSCDPRAAVEQWGRRALRQPGPGRLELAMEEHGLWPLAHAIPQVKPQWMVTLKTK